MDTIGTILKKRIKECGYTQEKFSELTNVPMSTLKKHMNGTTKYNYEYLMIYSEHLNCSYEYLLGKSESTKTEYKNIAEQTHFSEKAIEELIRLTNSNDELDKEDKRTLEEIICHPTFITSVTMYVGANRIINEFFDRFSDNVIEKFTPNETKQESFLRGKTSLEFALSVFEDLNDIKRKLTPEILEKNKPIINQIKDQIDKKE